MTSPFLACMVLTAHFYHLPPRVLPSIQAVEGGWVGAVIPNTDGSADLGPMQVNTLWVKPIAAYTHMKPQLVARRLITDPCFNIAAAAAILRGYMAETRGNLMLAIGDYHSHTPPLNQHYQVQVMAEAMRMFARE